MDGRLASILEGMKGKRLVFLTGAGLSAESGIPTFRGKEGYWTVGSLNYHPTELATRAAFSRMPEEIWAWYLYRRTVCLSAEPSMGHVFLAKLERKLGDSFSLVTQNIDGLHQRAGNSRARTFEVHGNIHSMRCWQECSLKPIPIPDAIGSKAKGDKLTQQDKAYLRCPSCDGPTRPHILWFDECYDEEHFRFHSSLEAASVAAALISVGSSGSTNLPMQMANLAAARGAVLIDINPEANPFSQLAQLSGGVFLQEKASSGLAKILEVLA